MAEKKDHLSEEAVQHDFRGFPVPCLSFHELDVGGSEALRSRGPAACGGSIRNSSSRHQACTDDWISDDVRGLDSSRRVAAGAAFVADRWSARLLWER